MPASRESITELAAARKAAYDVVERSVDDESGMKNMGAVCAVETNILAAPLLTPADKLAAKEILYEDGEPDFADGFKEQLALRLLRSI
jgi:hypothetical protein